jgi:hypothetical protein
MGRCPEPGEPGFNEGLAMGFLLRWALDLMRDVGPGLPLVNALGNRFPGASMEQLGRWATLANDSFAAGQRLLTSDPSTIIDLDRLPKAPGSGLWEENPLERYQLEAFGSRTRADGTVQHVTVKVWGHDAMTHRELMDLIEKAMEDLWEKYTTEGATFSGGPQVDIIFFVGNY